MNRFITLCIVLFVSTTSCDRWLDVSPPPIPVPVTSINSVTVSRYNIDFSLNVQTPEPCWKIAGFETELIDNRSYVAIFGQELRTKACRDTSRIAIGELRIPVQEPGEYKFGFWTINGATIDTTITVPEF